MHFKNPVKCISILIWGKKLNYSRHYNIFYLDEHINFLKGPTLLAESANRALGGVIGKTKTLRDIGFFTYSKLCQAYVCPVLDYVAVKTVPQKWCCPQ